MTDNPGRVTATRVERAVVTGPAGPAMVVYPRVAYVAIKRIQIVAAPRRPGAS